MNDASSPNREDLIREYKALLQQYLATRPSGLRRRIADAIGSNRSFASQITSPNYRVPVPSQSVHKLMDVCHFTPLERTSFLHAYIKAHPEFGELLKSHGGADEDTFVVDLSAVEDERAREIIRQALRSQAEALIALSIGKTGSTKSAEE